MSSEIEEIRRRKMDEMMASTKTGKTDAPAEPVEVTDANFDEFVSKHPRVVIDCWAPWCGPCRMLTPTIEAMARDKKGEVVFGKLNTDENQLTSGKYRIMSIPTLLYFKNGKLVHTTVGALPRPMIEEHIASNLS